MSDDKEPTGLGAPLIQRHHSVLKTSTDKLALTQEELYSSSDDSGDDQLIGNTDVSYKQSSRVPPEFPSPPKPPSASALTEHRHHKIRKMSSTKIITEHTSSHKAIQERRDSLKKVSETKVSAKANTDGTSTHHHSHKGESHAERKDNKDKSGKETHTKHKHSVKEKPVDRSNNSLDEDISEKQACGVEENTEHGHTLNGMNAGDVINKCGTSAYSLSIEQEKDSMDEHDEEKPMNGSISSSNIETVGPGINAQNECIENNHGERLGARGLENGLFVNRSNNGTLNSSTEEQDSGEESREQHVSLTVSAESINTSNNGRRTDNGEEQEHCIQKHIEDMKSLEELYVEEYVSSFSNRTVSHSNDELVCRERHGAQKQQLTGMYSSDCSNSCSDETIASSNKQHECIQEHLELNYPLSGIEDGQSANRSNNGLVDDITEEQRVRLEVNTEGKEPLKGIETMSMPNNGIVVDRIKEELDILVERLNQKRLSRDSVIECINNSNSITVTSITGQHQDCVSKNINQNQTGIADGSKRYRLPRSSSGGKSNMKLSTPGTELADAPKELLRRQGSFWVRDRKYDTRAKTAPAAPSSTPIGSPKDYSSPPHTQYWDVKESHSDALEKKKICLDPFDEIDRLRELLRDERERLRDETEFGREAMKHITTMSHTIADLKKQIDTGCSCKGFFQLRESTSIWEAAQKQTEQSRRCLVEKSTLKTELQEMKRELGQVQGKLKKSLEETAGQKSKVVHLMEDVSNLTSLKNILEARIAMGTRTQPVIEEANDPQKKEEVTSSGRLLEALKYKQSILVDQLSIEKDISQQLRSEVDRLEQISLMAKHDAATLEQDIASLHEQIEQLMNEKQFLYKEYVDIKAKYAEHEKDATRTKDSYLLKIKRLLFQQSRIELDIVDVEKLLRGAREQIQDLHEGMKKKDLQLLAYDQALQELRQYTLINSLDF